VSPWPGPLRPKVTFRLRKEAIEATAAHAEVEGVTPSEMYRRFTEYGLEHMPKGWTPEGEQR
jgi:hypothetical protein